jgi:galactose mutarotase-like enzyme
MPDLVSIASGELSADINPFGAELHALRDKEGRDLLWDGDQAFWTGRAPILFPVIGMLNEGRYRLDGKVYALGKHGFARKKPFEVVESLKDRARFRLTDDEETRRSYPFAFALDLSFTVVGPSLQVSALVSNRDTQPLPASFGFHPALRWPLPYGGARSEHRVVFETAEPEPISRINADGLVLPEGFPTPVEGDVLRLRDDLFVDDAVIFDPVRSQAVRYGPPTGPHLRVQFPKTPFLGIWTKPGAGFICIEPWHGHADPLGYTGDFRDKPGSFIVPPGGTFEAGMSISLSSS